MTKRLPFTEAGLRRAIVAARKAGLQVKGIRIADGTLLVEDNAEAAADQSETLLPDDDSAIWSEVQA